MRGVEGVADGQGGCKDEFNDGGVFPDTAELTDLEKKMNDNGAFHSAVDTLDTRVRSCEVCNRRMLRFAMAVHHHKCHEAHVQEEGEEDGV